MNDFWSDRCRDVSRPSSSALGVQHLLRCSPSVDAQGPGDLDSLLRTALSRADHNQYSVRLAVASGKFTRQVRWSRHQKSIFSRITCLHGHSGKYSSVAGRDSWWLSAVARRVGRVSERSLGGLVWSSPLRSVGNKAVVVGQSRSSGRLCRGGDISNLAVSASLSRRECHLYRVAGNTV